MTPIELKTLIDANRTYLLPVGSDDVQPDGYVSTHHLLNLLCASVGTIPNPLPAPQIPKPLTLVAVMGCVGTDSMAKVVANPNLVDVRDKITANDHQAVGLWAQLFAMGGVITSAELAAINAVLAQTIPDPNWPTTVSAPPLATGITLDDIDAALGRKPE